MKTALVSQILPQTNYSRYLAHTLKDCLVYTDKRQENLKTELKNRVRLTFTLNSLSYPLEILKQAKKDKVELLHLQHEFNMFGTRPINACFFLFLSPLLRLFGFKVVTTIHAVVKPSQVDKRFLETFGWPTKKYWIFPIKIFLFLLYFSIGRFCQKVIVHSLYLKEILVKKYQVSPSKIEVVNIGIPTVDKKQTGILPKEVKKPYLLYFGYFHRRKGLLELAEAFEKVAEKEPKLKLVLAGGCLQKDFENEIKNLVKKLDLEKKVVFTGFVELPTLRALLENSLAVVMPLSYSIAGSGPLAEVAAHHKPLITTSIGVNKHELTHNKNALLVPPKDPESLAQAIIRVVKDKTLQEKLSRGMREMQKERGWPIISKETENVYKLVANG